MIDQFNDDGTGWARFSDDMTMRYRLARSLTGRPITTIWAEASDRGSVVTDAFMAPVKRVVFLMLNPSTADAFESDPTITECRKRALALGADVLEVVNLFAFRSPYPADLKKRAHGQRGDDHENNHAIMEACSGAHCVIAAWGSHGHLGGRSAIVLDLLKRERIELHNLGVTKDGFPKHPLARGVHRIPADFAPQLWGASNA